MQKNKKIKGKNSRRDFLKKSAFSLGAITVLPSHVIFSKPAEGAQDVNLGGKDFSTLFVSCEGRLFSRNIHAKGIVSWLPAVKPPRPGL